MISVVVATVGRSRILQRCLEAIASGTLRPAEIVLVDQSTNGVGPLAERCLTKSGVQLRLVSTPPIGVSAARNLGTREAAGELLAFTDDDCVPEAEWLHELVLALERALAGAATGRVLPLHDGDTGRIAVSLRTDPQERIGVRGDEVAPWMLGTGGNLLVRRETLERTGGFDEAFGPGGRYRAAEDIEFLERLMDMGSSVVYTPAAAVYHEMKTPREALARCFPYGYGMGALVAKADGRRRRRLSADYAAMQLRETAAALGARSAPRLAEPPLTVAGFVAGFVGALADGRPRRGG